MTDSMNPDYSPNAVDGVDDPEAAHSKLPESLQFLDERIPGFGFRAERSNCGLDTAFQLRWEVANDVSDVLWNIDLKSRFQFRGFFL